MYTIGRHIQINQLPTQIPPPTNTQDKHQGEEETATHLPIEEGAVNGRSSWMRGSNGNQ